MDPILDHIEEPSGNPYSRASVRFFQFGLGLILLVTVIGLFLIDTSGIIAITYEILLALSLLTSAVLFGIGFAKGIRAFRKKERPKWKCYIGLVGNGLLLLFWIWVLLLNVLDVVSVFAE